MKYYRDPATGVVYAYELDGSQDGIIEPSFVPMTDEEVQAFLNPPLTPEIIKAANEARQSSLLAQASQAMAPILVSLQLGDATYDETVTAKAWQAYYRALTTVDMTVIEPDWPVAPE